MKKALCGLLLALVVEAGANGGETPSMAMPATAKLVFEEDWSGGTIDPGRWYVLHKKWGDGNHGVVRQNVFIARDRVAGKEQNVLVCRVHGDQYQGPVVGWEGRPDRVGGVIVSKPFFASGRFEVVMKIGDAKALPGGPADPTHPVGMVPAIWTYAYQWVGAGKGAKDAFSKDNPMYNPHLDVHGWGDNEYWSELDFPELGKGQDFTRGLYNGFLNRNQQSRTFAVGVVADGKYHTFTTLWRTQLVPFPKVSDAQVVAFNGHWWIQDKNIPFAKYRGNPLKKLGKDQYALCSGKEAIHFIDGKYVGTNPTFVPAMAAQLNIGGWLPEWGGAAPWSESSISVASVKVWQFDDPGDVRGVLTEDIGDNMDAAGMPLKP